MLKLTLAQTLCLREALWQMLVELHPRSVTKTITRAAARVGKFLRDAKDESEESKAFQAQAESFGDRFDVLDARGFALQKEFEESEQRMSGEIRPGFVQLFKDTEALANEAWNAINGVMPDGYKFGIACKKGKHSGLHPCFSDGATIGVWSQSEQADPRVAKDGPISLFVDAKEFHKAMHDADDAHKKAVDAEAVVAAAEAIVNDEPEKYSD